MYTNKSLNANTLIKTFLPPPPPKKKNSYLALLDTNVLPLIVIRHQWCLNIPMYFPALTLRKIP